MGQARKIDAAKKVRNHNKTADALVANIRA